MSLKRDCIISAQDFIDLKARVKAEMNRRNGNGSLTTYAGTVYDYTNIPSERVVVSEEHYSKIRDLQANINPSGLPSAKSRDDIVSEMTTLETKMTVFEAKPRSTTVGGTNDCAAACTGMCISQCTTTCTGGCTGSCTSCTGSCTGGCSSCSGGCTSCSGCSGGCTSCSGCSGCSGTCTGTCSGCSGGCTSCFNCTGGCIGCTSCSSCSGCTSCSGTCSGACSGCVSECGLDSCSSCTGACNTTCKGHCWASNAGY